MELKPLIRDYLKEAKLMQLATSVSDHPWVCSVWFAADQDLNIYWFSSITRKHSLEVEKNNHVAAAFALPHTPEDKPRGLQVEGIGELLTEQADIDKATSVYKDRIFSEQQIKDSMQSTKRPHKFYRLRPIRFVLFDIVNFPENSR